jgi:putative DNA primase/helicase
MMPREFAARYAALGWAVFPVACDKRPLIKNWPEAATVEPDQIRDWWARWPCAQCAIVTGTRSGLIALDIDVRGDYSGFAALPSVGLAEPPVTPTAKTPSGGVHWLFRAPGRVVPTTCLSRGVDVRGERASIILPPGPKRVWASGLAFDEVELARWPEAISDLIEVRQTPAAPRPVRMLRATQANSAYMRGALESACREIEQAPNGEQEKILTTQAFKIGRLAEREGVRPEECLGNLVAAGCNMKSFDPQRPWRPSEVNSKINRSFFAGYRKHRSIG